MKPAGQMTLTLTSELEQFVRDEVKRGAFASSSEYVRNLVRERYQRERDRAAKLRALEAALARGLADAEAGRVVTVDEAFRRLRAELKLARSQQLENEGRRIRSGLCRPPRYRTRYRERQSGPRDFLRRRVIRALHGVIDNGASVSALARVGRSRRPPPTVRRLLDLLPDLGARSAGVTRIAWRTGLRASSVP